MRRRLLVIRRVTCQLACGFAIFLVAAAAIACPFCTAVGPTFAQQRDQATTVALAEVLAISPPKFQVHRVLKGETIDAAKIDATLDANSKVGSLVLLVAEPKWTAIPVNETSAAYFIRSPDLRIPEVERLNYFVKFLEHPDPAVADDAYREFGRASINSVAEAAKKLPADQLAAWLTSKQVPEARKGLYGLMAGLAIDPDARAKNEQVLQKLIEADSDDFRAGFDGVLGGYLLLTGERGLTLIEDRLLADPKAKVGDVRHAMTALRFYREHGQQISPERLSAALAKTLDRPAFAAAAITDLARWQAWSDCDTIAALFDKPEFADPQIERAIIGYLHACPSKEAATQLAALRSKSPERVENAEAVLRATGSLNVRE